MESAEAITEDFYKKNPNFFKTFYANDGKKTLPKPWWSTHLQKLIGKRERFYKIFRKKKAQATPHPVEKSWKMIQSLAKKNKKEDWENFASSLNGNTPINQAGRE